MYCEIILILWTFNILSFMGKSIHELKIPRKYLFTFEV